MVRACKLTDGTFVLDPNYDSATMALAPGALCTDNNVVGAPSNGGQPFTFREFYTGEWRTGFHEETVFGGMALSRVEPNILSSGFDSTGTVWTQGITAVGRDGTLPSGALGLTTDDGTSDRFGKGGGMADLEVLCDLAPIQIGNRVWADTNGNGIQDPNEVGIGGVTVHLYNVGGELVDTTVTDPAGHYYFDGLNVSGGLLLNTSYVIALDNPVDYAAAGPLVGRKLTVADAGGNNLHDSDGTLSVGSEYPQIAVTTGGAGNDNHSFDFGFLPPVSIGDYLWIDANRDGIQDLTESPVPNVTVTLLGTNGGLVGTTTTNADGYYSFTDLVPSTGYTVQFPTQVTVGGITYFLTLPLQGGDAATDSNPNRVTGDARVTTPATGTNLPGPGLADDPTIDAGYVAPVSIGDYLWIDADGDGIQSVGEAPVPNATVTLFDADGVVLAATTTSDANGFYAFTNLPPDTDFTVRFPTSVTVGGIEYILTAPGQGADTSVDSNPHQQSGDASVTTPHTGSNSGLPGQTDDPTIDAGYFPKPVSIGDYVWLDLNSNGIQDGDEAPVADIVVTLLDADGAPVGTAITDADGYYAFTGLLPNAAYTVQFPTTVTLDGAVYALTTPGQGMDIATDSNPDPGTGQAPVWTPISGTNLGTPGDADDPTIDAGYAPMVFIGDFVWIDWNSNGIQDAGEDPVSGVTVTLLDAGGVVATTTTDSNGFYSFTNLPGNTAFSVQFPVSVTVDGIVYDLTTPGQGSRTSNDSNPDPATGLAAVTTPVSGTNLGTPEDADDPTIDAGYVPRPVSIGDYVWIDADGDGIQDVGENPVAGALVTLLDFSGVVVGTTTTDAGGYYAFTDLLPHTDYVVQFPTTVTVAGVAYTLTDQARAANVVRTLTPTRRPARLR